MTVSISLSGIRIVCGALPASAFILFVSAYSMVAASGSFIMLMPAAAFDFMVLCIVSSCVGVIFTPVITVASSGLALSSRRRTVTPCFVAASRNAP